MLAPVRYWLCSGGRPGRCRRLARQGNAACEHSEAVACKDVAACTRLLPSKSRRQRRPGQQLTVRGTLP
jgi:hypothetical protein